MGAALETVTGFLTTSSLTAGTYAALTANSTQSYTVRATPTSQAGNMLGVFAQANLAGYFQVKSARMHDTTIGTTFYEQPFSSTFSASPLTANDYDEPIWSTDVLTVQFTPLVTISGGETDILSLQMYYPNLPGVAANFKTWAEIQSLVNADNKVGLHYVSWVRPSTAGTAGNIGTGVAINSTNDQFRANHSYALLGYLPGVKTAAVLFQGIDTGNLYVGGPGTIDPKVTRNYFVDLSLAQGFATIPVFQANNKGGSFVYLMDGQTTSTASTVGLIWMDLGILGPVSGV